MKPLAQVGYKLILDEKHISELEKQKNNHNRFYLLFKDKTVLNGPFIGMKYPSMASAGSAMFPKLLGSYEKEIQTLIEEICNKSYTEILDIGCAEGYYAVGFGLRIKQSKIIAYDIDPTARELCSQMALLNKISKIEIKSKCGVEELKNFNFSGPGLVISDCEGYEFDLFNEETAQNLKKCDLLIEAHDNININISTKLCEVFSRTHHIKIIPSIDDIEKAKTYYFPQTAEFDLETKRILYSEGRPTIMEWIFFTPKN